MRLYSRTEATAVDDPEFGHFTASDDGGFDFPGPLSDRLHASHVRGEQQWETAIERQHRLIQEEAARRADPATLLSAVEQLVAAAKATEAPAAKPVPTGVAAPAPAHAPAAKAPAPKPSTPRRAASK